MQTGYGLLKNGRATVLGNGAAVVTSAVEDAQSVSFGLMVAAGGRYETPAYGGASHFLEHMLFKGTPRRSALEISRAIEGRGGYLNAYTGADSTCFYARVPYEFMGLAVDVMSDMYLNATIAEDEFARERGVILEEIKMYDDQPQQVVQENFEKALFQNHPLGMPLAGDPANLARMTNKMLLRYKAEHYVPGATVFSFSGRLRHDDCVAAVARAAGGMRRKRVPAFRPVDASTGQGRLVVERRGVSQVQAVLGCRMFGRRDGRRMAARLLSCILGDNMSSRLFQSVRERRGLCYSIQSSAQTFDETGMFAISLGTDPKRARAALRLVARELRRISEKLVSARELSRAKDYVVGTHRMGLESTSAQMLYLGESYLNYGHLLDQEELMESVRAVTAEEIRALAAELFDPEKATLSLVVPKEQPESDDAWLDALRPA